MGSTEVSSVRADDPRERAALDAFMAQGRHDLVALAYVMTGSQEPAQDVVHEVFARLLRTDLSTVSDLRAYARRAVTDECATWGRGIARSRRRSHGMRAEWNRVLNTQPDPSDGWRSCQR